MAKKVKKKKNTFVIGYKINIDNNISSNNKISPNMNWEQLSFRQNLGTNNNQACGLLLNFMGKKFLNQVVDKNTRNKNTLDIVLTNNVRDILDVSLIQHLFLTITLSE